MTLAALSPNWQVTVLFFLFLLPLCFVMKFAALRAAPGFTRWELICSPFPTPVAVQRALPLSAAPRLLRRFFIALAACVPAYALSWKFLSGHNVPLILLSYAGAIVLWLVSEALGSLAPFVAIFTGRLLPLPHGSAPPLATSLSDFWGRRWNVWTSDWFRQVIFRPLQARPVLALLLSFFVSGVAHEWVINVPLYLVTGRKCFGWMTLYFLLQGTGILIERKVNRNARVFLVWLFVFGAAPLMVNEGMLRILHLWP